MTKNGLRISTGYIIPTIPDIVSTWGIYQIVDNIARFAKDTDRPIPAIGIVATKVQANNLHRRVVADLQARRLGRFSEGGQLPQPPLFANTISQAVDVARGADVEADFRTFKGKYGTAYAALHGLTKRSSSYAKRKRLMSLLRGLVDLLVEETDRNPAFSDKLEQLLTVLPARGRPPRPFRKSASVPPPDLYAEHAARGETDLLVWLRDLPVSTLRSLIRTNDFDPTRRTSNWRETEKLAAFIVDSLRSRMTRGLAFMTKG